MRTTWMAGAAVLLAFTASEARADDRHACLDAAAQGQTLRDAHKIVEARDQFRACAQESCPAVVQKDCAAWLDAAEKSLPTVVVSAKDDHGADLFDVNVSLDGQRLTAKLDGTAVPVDPGRHTLHFEWAGGQASDESVLVREGEKDQRIAVVLHGAGAPAGATGGGATGGTEATPGAGMRTAGWVIGAIGVVGLGLGAAFGVSAINNKSSANCNSQNECDHDALSRAKSSALIADVGLIGGGVLVVTGGGLILFAPHGNAAASGAIRLSPMVGAGSAGALLGGSW